MTMKIDTYTYYFRKSFMLFFDHYPYILLYFFTITCVSKSVIASPDVIYAISTTSFTYNLFLI